jgi:DNA-binding transcriptional ArsR family regulator
MDTPLMSARQAARALGTSAPRVLRALADAGMAAPGGRPARLTPAQVAELGVKLGVGAPSTSLGRTEARVAAALARSPLGLASVRAVARRASVSPTAAGRALASLREGGLVRVEERSLPGRRAHSETVVYADYASPAWRGVVSDLARVRSPRERPSGGSASRVPARLNYLFWDTADSQKDVDRAGGYIARRLLQSGDPEGIAWGAEHLAPRDWLHAAATRGLAPGVRALGRNLAGARGESSAGQRGEGAAGPP